MAIVYRVNIVDALKDAGYSTYRIRKEKLIPQGAMTSIRHGEMISMSTLDSLCRMLDCQPGDLLEYKGDTLE